MYQDDKKENDPLEHPVSEEQCSQGYQIKSFISTTTRPRLSRYTVVFSKVVCVCVYFGP